MRRRHLFQQSYVGDDAMTAYETGEVTTSGKKLDLFKELDGFLIVSADLGCIPIELLSKRNQEAEVSSLGQLRELEGFDIIHSACGKTRLVEMGLREVGDR